MVRVTGNTEAFYFFELFKFIDGQSLFD